MKSDTSPYVIVGTPSEIFALRLNDDGFVVHLWRKDSTGEWVEMMLNGVVMTLTKDGVYPASIGQDKKTEQGSVFIKSWRHFLEINWIVVPGPFRKGKEMPFVM